MTAKEEAIALIQRLPGDVSFDEITGEILRARDLHETVEERAEVMEALRTARESIAAGGFKSHEEVVEIVRSWSGKWDSK